MGPESRAKGLCCSPELSCWAAGNGPTQEQNRPHFPCEHCLGQDHVDGQILGQLRPLTEEEEEEGAGAASPGRPAFPEMGSEELRLSSFYDWPVTAGVQPELLAAAGFFHTGQQDKVRCFFCYGGLQNWERGDDPWTEHARWFPRAHRGPQELLNVTVGPEVPALASKDPFSRCQFLLQSKGRGFVQSVQACVPLRGSWDEWEELEDAMAAVPPGSEGWIVSRDLFWGLLASQPNCSVNYSVATNARGGQEQSAWSQSPGVSSRAPSQLVADLQEEDRDQVAGARGAGDVQEQLRRLHEERRCKVCLDRVVSVVFVPCGHLVCPECAPSLQLCPICRAPIQSCVRTFLS